MNNQAFRKLVYQHTNKSINKSSSVSTSQQSQFKSSKEIARDAVQEEFNEIKKKRKFGNGGFDGDFDMSDDDDNDYGRSRSSGKGDDDDNNDDEDGDPLKTEKQNKRTKQWKKGKQSNDNDDDNEQLQRKKLQSKYRDRAKERREGTNLDYQAAESLAIPNTNPSNTVYSENDKNMTKFLGGDEQFTHLVKGLDKSLADKVRREEMSKHYSSVNIGLSSTEPMSNASEDIDLDKVMEDAQALKAEKLSKLKQVNLDTVKLSSTSSSLASTMASYLQKKQASTNKNHIISPLESMDQTKLSSAGQTILRSNLTFSLYPNRQNLLQYGWEIPNTTIGGRMNQSIILSSCTPIDRNLIKKIKYVFGNLTRKQKIVSHSDKSRNEKTKSDNIKNKDKGVKNLPDDSKTEKQVLDDSDDDIYGDIGNYVPPSIQAANKNM